MQKAPTVAMAMLHVTTWLEPSAARAPMVSAETGFNVKVRFFRGKICSFLFPQSKETKEENVDQCYVFFNF